MIKQLLVLSCLALASASHAQNVEETFTGTRVINGHSVETLKGRILEFRIEHRFGDIAGTNGGVQQFFGFDQAADIRFAFEYGLTDKWMIGLGRSKGTGSPYRSLVDGFTKYRILTQEKDGTPLSLAAMGSAVISYQQASDDLTQVISYPKFSHRMAYSAQIIAARKFGEKLSLQIMPTYVHRNLVTNDDSNGLFSLGGAINYKFNKTYGLIVEYYQNFNPAGLRENMKNSLGVAFEWTTNGHNFKMNFTNSRGFGETQFIPYTTSDWLAGEFRFGFSISRKFKL
ncbi:MAG: hypothetical protein HWE22_12065 [Flavobacteriales bacterium]|nr:hypothetical protein [Flavobacteriales bacterium]